VAPTGRDRQSRRARSKLASLLAGAASLALASGCGSSAGGVPHPFYGIAPSTTLTRADFARMANANVGSLRFGLSWPALQAAPGAPFNWTLTDPFVAGAAREGIELLATLDGTPSFEAGGCTTCTRQILVATAAQRAAWKAFVKAAVERYGPGGSFWSDNPSLPEDPIRRWQIWNEQNSPNQKNPAPRYARLLRLSDHAIESVDPGAEIVLGGMFGTPVGSRRQGVTAWSYLNRLYAAGARRDFDAVALHPYARNLAGIAYQIRRVRAVLDGNGDGAKSIFVDEIGWGSGAGTRYPGTGSRGQVFVVSPRQQKRNLIASFRLLTNHRNTWHIAGVYWYGWKDPLNPPPGLCAFCYSSGLYEANGKTPKPALAAFERFTGRTGS
jgi:polysaccharide biosynthesis protein PslG